MANSKPFLLLFSSILLLLLHSDFAPTKATETTTVVSKEQTECTMCDACENPCQPQPSPPPPVVECPPPPAPPPPMPPKGPECPPPPMPPCEDKCKPPQGGNRNPSPMILPFPQPPPATIPYFNSPPGQSNPYFYNYMPPPSSSICLRIPIALTASIFLPLITTLLCFF